jgi:tRNA pseudouridine38-40 synthase
MYVCMYVCTETLEIFRETLRKFEGTHSFHNFTSGKTSTDANASRYILSFSCSEPFLSQGSRAAAAAADSDNGESDSEGKVEVTEWVLLSVLGQSFLLNQIRKMVSMAVEVVRRSVRYATSLCKGDK